MNNRLSQSYRSLGPAERALLLIAAAARDDLADAYALLSAAPRRTFTAANSYCTSVALHALISTFLTDQLFHAIGIFLLLHAPDDLDTDTIDGVSDVIPRLAATYITQLDGWRIFCRRHGIPDSPRVLTFPFHHDEIMELLEKLFTPLANLQAERDSAAGSGNETTDPLVVQARAFAQSLEEQYAALTKPPPPSNSK